MFHGIWESKTGIALQKGYRTIANAMNKAAYSWVFILLVSAMALYANIYAAELPVYTAYIVFAISICLFCRDLLPIMPMVICSYIAPSIVNNPGRNPESIFFPQYGGYFLIAIAALFVAVLLVRLIIDKEIGFLTMFKIKRKLIWGIVVLGVAYLISGIGAEGYEERMTKNLFFAFLQFVSLALMYFVFAGGVKWENAPKWYLPAIGVAAGFVLIGELLHVYNTQAVLVDGVIDRVRIYTGWGMYNNIGGMLIMVLPFPFYFACKRKVGWLGLLTGTLFMLSIGLTSSRGSILTGLLVYGLCIIITLIFSENRKETFLYVAVIVGVAAFAIYWHWDTITKLLTVILEKGLETSRTDIFKAGIEQFHRYPVVGGGFYPVDFVPWDFSEVGAFSDFFPPRWHNTVVQLLACCGVVGLAAYVFHCGQVAWVLLKKVSLLKMVVLLSVMALMVSSMLDCHFFNIGPVLVYSMALAVAEFTPCEKKTES